MEDVTDYSLPMTPRGRANNPRQTLHNTYTKVKQPAPSSLIMLDRVHNS